MIWRGSILPVMIWIDRGAVEPWILPWATRDVNSAPALTTTTTLPGGSMITLTIYMDMTQTRPSTNTLNKRRFHPAGEPTMDMTDRGMTTFSACQRKDEGVGIEFKYVYDLQWWLPVLCVM
eukprot:FR735181.1.p2 GENE.FR735181.1~~FR735181.1.p2  ORF type:complete len:121 (+),score=5.31 FR735181.1:451-813(+)